MNSRVKFQFRFATVLKKIERDSRAAELVLAGHHAQVETIKAEIIEKQNMNQRLAEAWNRSLRTSSESSIESRLVFHREHQGLVELQAALQHRQADVEQAKQALMAIRKRLRSIELIRDKDLALFERELKNKGERDTLEIVLRKTFSASKRKG